jgi:hypothetical protein
MRHLRRDERVQLTDLEDMPELLLQHLPWPIAFVVAALAISLVFRKSLAEVIRRGGLTINKDGLSIDQAAAAAAASVQSEAMPIDTTLKLDPETERQVCELKQAVVPAVIREQQTRIRTDLGKLNLLNNQDDVVDILIQHLAIYQLLYATERIYRIIFGSQIAILKYLNFQGETDIYKVRTFYEEAKAKFPLLYEKYRFATYLHFLTSSNLVATIDNITYVITPLGKEFLQWMIAQGISDAKPF